MSEPHVDYPSTGVTLEGDELDPEEDPYEPESEEKRTESSSIYPIKAKVEIKASFTDAGRNPFWVQIVFRRPYDTESIPSSRYKEAKKDLKKKVDMENPELGVIGEITFGERDHRIKLYPEEQKETKTLGEWVLEQFYHMLEKTDGKHFTSADIPVDDVRNIQETVIDNLPGDFITVAGVCSKCDEPIEEEEVYVDEGRKKGFAMCDCGVGTTYEQKEDH